MFDATTVNEKSWRRIAASSTASATSTGAEEAVERVARAGGEAAVAADAAERADDRGVGGEQQGEVERAAAERSHQLSDFVPYFDGHFVTSESVFATNTPSCMRPSTTTCLPSPKASGTSPW